jgi:ABC-type Fe3+ transport system permease subunit
MAGSLLPLPIDLIAIANIVTFYVIVAVVAFVISILVFSMLDGDWDETLRLQVSMVVLLFILMASLILGIFGLVISVAAVVLIAYIFSLRECRCRN